MNVPVDDGGLLKPDVVEGTDDEGPTAWGGSNFYRRFGRILRPLLVVENLKKIKRIKGHYNFLSLPEDGIIQMVGVEEEEDCRIAGD
ncbi:hypothetical protein Syun_002271 [Stephania yunnanensis]|uniref:Uncharacterized protein n=1 Tax=Stephania yunnanensis TaxID=152371 RepID=A0AAP0LFH6_9MAGN